MILYKNILSILLVSVILFGCDTKTDDPIESRYHIDKTIEKNQTFCLKSNNQKVIAWTINKEDEMKTLIKMGVDGIMTDNLTLLKSVLIEESLW